MKSIYHHARRTTTVSGSIHLKVCFVTSFFSDLNCGHQQQVEHHRCFRTLPSCHRDQDATDYNTNKCVVKPATLCSANPVIHHLTGVQKHYFGTSSQRQQQQNRHLMDATNQYMQRHSDGSNRTVQRQQQNAYNLILQWLAQCDSNNKILQYERHGISNTQKQQRQTLSELDYATMIIRTLPPSAATTTAAADDNSTSNASISHVFHRVLWQHVKANNYKVVLLLMNEFYGQHGIITMKAYAMAYQSLQQYCSTSKSAAQQCIRYCNYWYQQQQQQMEVNSFNEETSPAVKKEQHQQLLVAQNAYVHTLAKCAIFDTKLPQQIQEYVWSLDHADGKTHAAVLLAWANAASTMRDASFIDQACAYHDRLRTERGIHHTWCYNICINALGKLRRAERAEQLLWEMHDISRKQEPHNTTQRNDTAENTTATTPTDSKPIQNHSPQKLNDLEENEAGIVVQIDKYTILAVLNAYAKNNEPKKALNLLQHLTRVYDQQQSSSRARDDATLLPKPTIEMYTAVMDAYARCSTAGRRNTESIGENVETLLHQLEHLYASGNGTGSNQSLQPAQHMYNIAIRAWANSTTGTATKFLHDDDSQKLSPPHRAMKIVHRMVANPLILPCTITYSTLIQVWGNTRSLLGGRYALALFRQMEDHTTQQQNDANEKTGDGSIEKTEDASLTAADYDNEMSLPVLPSSCRVRPNTVTLNNVLQALTTSGLVEEAHDLLREAAQRIIIDSKSTTTNNSIGVLPDAKSWAIVAHGYVKFPKNVSNEDISKRTELSVQHQLLLELEYLYEHATQMTLQPTTGFYATVLYSYRDGHIETASELFWRVVQRSVTGQRVRQLREQTTSKTEKSEDTTRQQLQSGEMQLLSVEPDTFLCNTMMNVWSHNANSDEMIPQDCEGLYMWMSAATAAKASSVVQPNEKSIQYVRTAWEKSERHDAPQRIKSFLQQIREENKQ